jgi:hypothetical protein
MVTIMAHFLIWMKWTNVVILNRSNTKPGFGLGSIEKSLMGRGYLQHMQYIS